MIIIVTDFNYKTMKTNFRTQVFKKAYELTKVTGKCFSVCLSRAWALYRLIKAMKNGIVWFAYEKADGSLRKAKGTLKGTEYLVKGYSRENFKTVCYFDVEAEAFRSFRCENLITIY